MKSSTRCAILSVLILFLGLLDASKTFAKPEYLRTAALTYPIWQTRIGNCRLCHTKGGGSARSRYGRSFFAFGADANALKAIENDDSDHDGFSNLEEMVAGTFPGDPRDKPSERPGKEAMEAFKRRKRVAPGAMMLAGADKAQLAREIQFMRQRLEAMEAALAMMRVDQDSPDVSASGPAGDDGFAIHLDALGAERKEKEEDGFAIDLDGEGAHADAMADFGGYAFVPSGGMLQEAAAGIQWGGALDTMVRWVDGGESTSVHPVYNGRGTRTLDPFIHVAELVATTRIGDHVTLLGEALLPTEEGVGFRQLVAEKHGFFYAIWNDLPVLPRGSTMWIGRMRIPYGIDAVLDAPASPLDTLVTKLTGQISDIGLMLKGFSGPFEWSIAATDGADFNRIGISDNGIPVYVRTDLDLSRYLPGFHIGLSGFLGDHYRYADGILRTPASITGEDVVHKQRITLHAQMPMGRFSFFGEASYGRDDDDDFQAFFFRTDYNFTPKIVGHLVWDFLDTRYRETDFEDDPDPALARLATNDFTGDAEQFLRTGLSYHVSEQVIVRLVDDWKMSGSDNLPNNVLTTQLLLEF